MTDLRYFNSEIRQGFQISLVLAWPQRNALGVKWLIWLCTDLTSLLVGFISLFQNIPRPQKTIAIGKQNKTNQFHHSTYFSYMNKFQFSLWSSLQTRSCSQLLLSRSWSSQTPCGPYLPSKNEICFSYKSYLSLRSKTSDFTYSFQGALHFFFFFF